MLQIPGSLSAAERPVQQGQVAGVSNVIPRALLFLSAGAWALVMSIVGVLLVVDWPDRFKGLDAPWRAFGGVLLAAGVFIFAATVGRGFPRASRGVRSTFEAAPWLALGAGLAGGWLW